MNPLFRITLPAALLLSLGARAEDDAPLASGPEPGTSLTPVPCYATDGPLAGQEFDAAARLGKAPSALLFIHELTRNTAPVLRGLDDLAAEFSILGFKSFTIMLADDRTAGESQLQRVNGSLKLANPMVLSTDGAEGPGNYALNRKAALTLVFTKDGKVAKSLALTDTGPNDLPVIRAAIEEVAGKIPQDEAALRELVMAKLPSDAEALKELAARQVIELRRLRGQMAKMQQRMQPGMQRQPERRPMRGGDQQPRKGPDPNTPTTLNAQNLTGKDVADLYYHFTGKTAVVSQEAQAAEISIVVPGKLTYAEAAKAIEEKLKLEGFSLEPVEGSPGLLTLKVADPAKFKPREGGPVRVQRVPAPPARPDDAQAPKVREGKPPADPELQTLLRTYIRKTNDDARTSEVFADIKARGAESDELHSEVVEMFKLMLSIDYGNEHAQEMAREFLKANAPTDRRDGTDEKDGKDEENGDAAPPARNDDAKPDPDTPTSLNVQNATGEEIAELYKKFTGKTVLVSAEAAAAEISLVVPGQLTYARAATVIEKKLVLDGLALVPDQDNPSLMKLVLAGNDMFLGKVPVLPR